MCNDFELSSINRFYGSSDVAELPAFVVEQIEIARLDGGAIWKLAKAPRPTAGF
jgi:hypothetical protein